MAMLSWSMPPERKIGFLKPESWLPKLLQQPCTASFLNHTHIVWYETVAAKGMKMKVGGGPSPQGNFKK